MPYNLTNLTTSENFVDLLQATNALSDNLFGLIILFAILMILFLSMKNFPTIEAAAASFFITTMASIFFSLLGLVGPSVVIIFILMTSGAIIMLLRDK